jgi:hypothetical protein
MVATWRGSKLIYAVQVYVGIFMAGLVVICVFVSAALVICVLSDPGRLTIVLFSIYLQNILHGKIGQSVEPYGCLYLVDDHSLPHEIYSGTLVIVGECCRRPSRKKK